MWCYHLNCILKPFYYINMSFIYLCSLKSVWLCGCGHFYIILEVWNIVPFREKLRTDSGIFLYVFDPLSPTVNILSYCSKFVSQWSRTDGSCLCNTPASSQAGLDSDLPFSFMCFSFPGAHAASPYIWASHLLGLFTLWPFSRPPSYLETLSVLRVTSQVSSVDWHSGCVWGSPLPSLCCVLVEGRAQRQSKPRADTFIPADITLDLLLREYLSNSSLPSCSLPPSPWGSLWQGSMMRVQGHAFTVCKWFSDMESIHLFCSAVFYVCIWPLASDTFPTFLMSIS